MTTLYCFSPGQVLTSQRRRLSTDGWSDRSSLDGSDAPRYARFTTTFFPRNAIPILIMESTSASRRSVSYFFSSIC